MARFVIGALALLALWFVVEIAHALKSWNDDEHHRH
ncbi:hypothetical protein CPT_Magia_055 [Burkholderia phage Magia]|uniref:Uncharacterized protein n=1 Tax=Burkholderia phage Magia TaxID=2767577 RepID=A0A873WBT0_9CAUD|nr:hypothetical protein PQC04_gp55 [Burkholderia phage Magia]QPB08737.1 hypothetical protein CPT_Magia_055 [Burkholderia phage Magia]